MPNDSWAADAYRGSALPNITFASLLHRLEKAEERIQQLEAIIIDLDREVSWLHGVLAARDNT